MLECGGQKAAKTSLFRKEKKKKTNKPKREQQSTKGKESLCVECKKITTHKCLWQKKPTK